MTENGEGKDLPLTRYAIERASQQERLSYGALLAQLIERSGIQQKDLAEAANVSARTIRNIVQGKNAPQAENIIALLLALDVDVDDIVDADVRSWTKMLAPVIRRIDPEHRASAVAEAIGVLSDAALQHPFATLPENVTPLGRRAVGGSAEDLAEVAYETPHDYDEDTDDKYTE